MGRGSGPSEFPDRPGFESLTAQDQVDCAHYTFRRREAAGYPENNLRGPAVTETAPAATVAAARRSFQEEEIRYA